MASILARVRAMKSRDMMHRLGAFNSFFGFGFPACATLILLYLRAPQTFECPQFWAEDGREFFRDEKLYGIGSLFIPYAGYLHLVPRLIALVASPFSAGEAPGLFAVASVLVTVWSSVTISAAMTSFASLLGALLVAAPHSGEIFGTVANLQWLMAPALVVVIATPTPCYSLRRFNQSLFVFASSLSGPFSIIALPLVMWRFMRSRSDAHSQRVCLIAFAGATVQVFAIMRAQGAPIPAVAPLHLAHMIIDRWIGQLAHGGLTTSTFQFAESCLVVAGSIVALFTRSRLFHKLLLFSTLLLFAVWLKFLGEPRDSFDHLLGNGRYLYVPRLFVLWALAVAALQVRARSIIAGAALLVAYMNYSSWEKPVLPVLPWRSEAWPIDHGDPVRIVINPLTGSDADAWTVTLPERP